MMNSSRPSKHNLIIQKRRGKKMKKICVYHYETFVVRGKSNPVKDLLRVNKMFMAIRTEMCMSIGLH